MRTLLPPTIVGLLLSAVPRTGVGTTASPGVDEHTVALWLFDDPPYANVTLTDAGPLQVDLRLDTGTRKPLPPGLLSLEQAWRKAASVAPSTCRSGRGRG